MKNRKWLLTFFIVTFLQGGCGVHVGNGLKKYQSDYGYEITYHESLSFKENADKTQVTISDKAVKRARANDNEEVASYTQFTVRPGETANNADELLNLTRGEARRYEKFEANGSVGVKYISESEGSYYASYYFVTTKRAVVRAEISARGEAKEKMKAIIGSYKGGGAATVAAAAEPKPEGIFLAALRDVNLGTVAKLNFNVADYRVEPVAAPAVKVPEGVKLLGVYEVVHLPSRAQAVMGVMTQKFRLANWMREGCEVHYFAKQHAGMRCVFDEGVIYFIRATDEDDMVVSLDGKPDKEIKSLVERMYFTEALTKNTDPLKQLEDHRNR